MHAMLPHFTSVHTAGLLHARRLWLVALVRCLRLAGRLCVWLSASPALSLVFHLQPAVCESATAGPGFAQSRDEGAGNGGARTRILLFRAYGRAGRPDASAAVAARWNVSVMKNQGRPLDHHHVIGCFWW